MPCSCLRVVFSCAYTITMSCLFSFLNFNIIAQPSLPNGKNGVNGQDARPPAVKDLEFELEPAAELAVEEPSLEETGNVWGVPQRSVAARSQNAKVL